MPDPVRSQVESLWGDEGRAGAAAQGAAPVARTAAPSGLLPARKIVLRIPGKPQPGGSKRAFTPRGWNRPIITDANPKAADWKRTVQVFAQQAMSGTVLEGPLLVVMRFHLARPQGHWGKRGLLPSAPPFPHRKPDVLKLGRSTEDALTGIVWRDDAQIVEERLYKVYAESGWTGVEIEVEEIGK